MEVEESRIRPESRLIGNVLYFDPCILEIPWESEKNPYVESGVDSAT
jgi:hypothetical protein